jgi:hypothetical protein
LQYHQIATINGNKLEVVSEGAITTLSNALTQIPGISSSSDVHSASTSLALTSFGIPLTGLCKVKEKSIALCFRYSL